MQLQLSQEILAHALQHVMKAVSMNPTIPLLTGIKISARSNGLNLTACNTSLMIDYTVPLQANSLIIQQTGEIVIPARYFYDIIRKLPAGTVTLESRNLTLSIQSEQSLFHLNGVDPEEFPLFPMKDTGLQGFRLPTRILETIVQQVSFAASSSDTRPVLTGVCFQLDGRKLRLTATDGIRLASRTIDVDRDGAGPCEIVIPGKNLIEISKIVADEHGFTDIVIHDSQVFFSTDRVSVYSVLLNGTYPSVDRVIPSASTTEMVIPASDFLHALERVSLLAGDNVIHLRTSSGHSLEMVAKTAEIGDVFDKVLLDDCSGDEINISLNGKYLFEIIRHIESHQVRMSFSGHSGPITIKPVDIDDTCLYLITPIRTR